MPAAPGTPERGTNLIATLPAHIASCRSISFSPDGRCLATGHRSGGVRLWDGLEAFAAYGDEVEPATLAAAATEALGIPPDATGLVDHDRIGDEWERSGGRVSIVALLLEQLGGS